MRKTYRYKNLVYTIAEDAEVNFTIDFVSDGNSGQTLINVPGNLDPEIENAGTAFLGLGKDLLDEIIICVSDIYNPIPEETEIHIRYKINGNILMEHVNPKSEEERPLIILFIRFSRP